MADREGETNHLTLGDVTFKTSGNILFEGGEGSYLLAESPLLDKMDRSIQKGILENGMQMLFKKISAAE